MKATSEWGSRMPKMLGRYELLGALARGGMATVYLARHRGEAGFQRLFAIKVLHAHLADDEEFVDMMLDEARIAARLHHPNVVPIVDLGSQEGIHYVVMEYIEGCSLSALLGKSREQRPPRLVVAIMLDVLAGLHAAHTLTDDDGRPMRLVHRDVSPQNVMVGVDGAARLTDFGIARAASRIMSTRPGQLKGKLAFMSPEQIRGAHEVDHRSDLFSAGAMLWSSLTGRRLFLGNTDAATLSNILNLRIPPPSSIGHRPPRALDAVFPRAMARDPAKRFASAQEMEEAVREAAEKCGCLGTRREVAAWVHAGFGDELSERRKAIKAAGSPGSSSHSGVRAMASIGPLRSSHLTPPGGVDPSASSPHHPTPVSGTSLQGAAAPALEPPPITATPASADPNPVQTALRAPPKPTRSRVPVFLGGAAASLLALMAVVLVVLMSTRKARSNEEPPVPTPTAPAAAAEAVPESPAQDTVVPSPEPAGAAAEPPLAASSERSTGARRGGGTGASRPAGPEPSAKEAAPAPPPPATTPKESVLWDKDSPLPPE